MVGDAELILVAGALLMLGVAASVIAAKLRMPALILFLGLGMALGTDGLGWIDFNDYSLARLIGTIALVLILFDGGLSAGWERISPVLRPAILLAVAGTAGTAAIAGLVAAWLFHLSVLEGLLLGAILAATDGAAMFPLLRGVEIPRRMRYTLEAEAGFNDPVAVILVLLLIHLIRQPGYGAGEVAVFVVREVGIGVGVGVGVGQLGTLLAERGGPLPRGMALVGSSALAALAYGAAASLEGSGFLAVYVAGLLLGRARWRSREEILSFHEGLASVAEIGMFLSLGLLVFPSQLGAVAARGVVLAVATAVLARPVATFAATVRQGFTPDERALLGWAGVRGAVPVILATLAVISHVPKSLEFFNIVFFAVLLSASVQGWTIPIIAARLRLGRRGGRRDPRGT